MNLIPHFLRIAAIFGVSLALAACKRHGDAPRSNQRERPAAIVRAQTVEAKKRMATEDVAGTVRAKLRASLEAKVSGRIEKMPVAQGQTVQAGALLVELDAREIQSRLEQALAQREQAEQDLKRFTTLVEQNAVTRQEFEAAQSRARVTRAAVSEAETTLAHTRITAPFAGVITRKLADLGDLAAPGKPLLELEDPASLRLEADVPEALIGGVRMGATMPVHVPALERELTGTVSEIAAAADAASRTFRVKLDLSPAPDLRAGLFGRVAVPIKESTALRVPASAVIVRGQLEIIFVVSAGRAQLRLVKTGKRVGDELELLSGVNAGESIVVEGAERLEDGQAVEVKP